MTRFYNEKPLPLDSLIEKVLHIYMVTKSLNLKSVQK
jgi:hypothetical protein